jgi:RAD51-like protein 2
MLASHMTDVQVIITSQLATKLLTLENKPANFDTGDRAVLMPQLGMLTRARDSLRPD